MQNDGEARQQTLNLFEDVETETRFLTRFEFICTVTGTDSDGERIHSRLFDKFLNLGRIGKLRVFFADIDRVLDAGQCNDSYSLAVIALKLKEVFGLDDINDLPIIYNISWYEQKAVIVLLALLSLGVKNIHLGPTLPAFLSPNVAALLVENFGIAGIDTVENDMELFFGK